MTDPAPLDLSVVVPVYNEVDNVEPLHAELHEVLSGLGRTYEIVYVDDGSPDGSVPRLKSLADRDPHVRVVLFRRNFGQTAALDAGFHHSRGQVVIPMDADLQNDPRDIPQMLARLDEGYDVVKGWRRDRKDKTLTRKVPSWLANRLISKVTGVRLHDYGCTLSAFRKEIIEQVHLYGEMHRFIPVYTHLAGGRMVEVPVNHRPRTRGQTKYGLMRTFRVLVDLMTVRLLVGYSSKPSYFFGKLSLWGFLAAFLLAGYTAWHKFVDGVYVKDQPLFLVAIFVAMASFQTLLIGLLAELIMRSYFESQGKRHYVVRQVYSRSSDGT